MKIIKGFAIFSVLVVFILCESCVNEPEFSVVPEIGIEKVSFVVTPKPEDADTLFLVLNFKDGDGDLGLPSNDIRYNSTPFNNINFFLENGGPIEPVGSSILYLNEVQTISPVIDIPNGASGTLVTLGTKDKPAYADLPEYMFPFTRTAYFYDTIYVREADKAILGDINESDFITPVDTIYGNNSQTYYALLEIFYFQPNENFSNIDVTFELKNLNPSPVNLPADKYVYEPFDWTKTDAVISPFNERFPVLGESEPLEGTITYAMNDTGFLDNFDLNTTVFRLKIQIKDRALHKSNIVYTGDLTLNDLMK
jgi:hypothetical protein